MPAGGALSMPTGRPDLTPTNDLARCRPATASSAQPGADAVAAVDGSPATDWQPTAVPAGLQVDLGARHTVNRATLSWGALYPPPPGPNQPPPPGPVQLLRATDYDLVASMDGHTWTVLASVRGRSTDSTDTLTFPATAARFVAVRISAATSAGPPQLMELVVTGS